MAHALRLDPNEYLEHKLIALDQQRGVLRPDVYELADTLLRQCIELFNRTHRLSSDVWEAGKQQDDRAQRERHRREMDAVLDSIDEVVGRVDVIVGAFLQQEEPLTAVHAADAQQPRG